MYMICCRKKLHEKNRIDLLSLFVSLLRNRVYSHISHISTLQLYKVLSLHHYLFQNYFSVPNVLFFCKALGHPIYRASESEANTSSRSWALSESTHHPWQRDWLGLEPKFDGHWALNYHLATVKNGFSSLHVHCKEMHEAWVYLFIIYSATTYTYIQSY